MKNWNNLGADDLGICLSRYLLNDDVTLLQANSCFYELIGYTKQENRAQL